MQHSKNRIETIPFIAPEVSSQPVTNVTRKDGDSKRRRENSGTKPHL